MALQKESPYIGLVNHYILLMKETGLLQRIFANAEPPNQFCDFDEGSPVGFKTCVTPFLLLAGGIILALGTFLGEKIVDSLKKEPMVDNSDLGTQPSVTVDTSGEEEISTIEIS